MPFSCPKFAPPGLGMEWTGEPLWDNPTIGLRGIPRGRTAAWSPVDPNTREGMAHQAPPWSTGRPGMATAYRHVGQG